MYNIETHGDFRRWYCNTQKRNYWILGYFGGGALNVSETYEVAKLFAEKTGVPFETVHIDEVLHSMRYKHFKFIYSTERNQIEERGSKVFNNVYEWLTD